MESTEPVTVAVNIRPLISPEILNGTTQCVAVAPNDPEVHIGSHTFTYDFVFGNSGMPSSSIYKHCVAPLVEALFRGYNATVLAYGQTASGKTYTMGTYHSGDETNGGIIQKVMDDIFTRVEATKNGTKPHIQVSFTEIYNEEVFDLLASNPSRAPIQIRETASGEVTLQGVIEAQVRTKEEMSLYLTQGSISRATGSTNMNSKSSRSHAIITISLLTRAENTVRAKLHLVDLAGSERANRTGADGMRMKESININKGLLALGTVINTLGDERKRKKGGHVPYRVSKLTRLLQDSLGGNSKTLMIACVSPAITNAEETLNTLRYAHRARNIQNKAVVQNPVSSVFDNLNRDGDDLVMSDVCSGSSGSRSQPKPSAPSFDYDVMFKEGTPPGSASLTVYDKPVYDGEDVFEAFSEIKILWNSQSAKCDDGSSSTSPPSKLRKPIYDDKLVYDEDVVEAIPEHEVPSSSQSARCGDGSSSTSPPSKLRKPVYDDKPVYDEDVVEAIHEPQIPSTSQSARCDDDGYSSTSSTSKLSKPVYDDKPVYDEDVAEAIHEPQIPSTRFDDVSSSSPSKLRKQNNFPLEIREMEPNKAESEREDKDQNKPVEFIDLTADERPFIDLTADETEFQDKGIKHCSLQEKLDMKLKELDKRKAEIRGSYQEKRALQREIECLRQKLASTSSATPCCTCSKSSTCKTVRCQCVVSNCFCVSSCGCSSLKCSNRSREERLL